MPPIDLKWKAEHVARLERRAKFFFNFRSRTEGNEVCRAISSVEAVKYFDSQHFYLEEKYIVDKELNRIFT